MGSKKQNRTIDDSTLVKRCQQGDSLAMETLIRKYQDRIFNLILKISSNYDDAAELTQDTFVKAIEKINDFRGKSSFYTWLYRIAVNLTLNYCKRRVKLITRSLEETFDCCGESVRGQLKSFLVSKDESDPASLIQNKETAEIVMAALDGLDEEHKTILLLREIESMSYADISEILGIEIGTVKSRLFRARENLREVFDRLLS